MQENNSIDYFGSEANEPKGNMTLQNELQNSLRRQTEESMNVNVTQISNNTIREKIIQKGSFLLRDQINDCQYRQNMLQEVQYETEVHLDQSIESEEDLTARELIKNQNVQKKFEGLEAFFHKGVQKSKTEYLSEQIDGFEVKKIQRKYTSRRNYTNCDDCDSHEDDDEYFEEDTPNIEWKDTQGNHKCLTSNLSFTKHKNLFKNLVSTQSIVTDFPICTMIISFDSKLAIAVQKKNEKESYISQHEIRTNNRVFYEKFGGEENSYIKIKEVAQNSKGDQFAACYMDNGKFRMRIFGQRQRSVKEIKIQEIKFNEMFGLSDFSTPIYEFPDPYITCCFVNDTQIFVAFFHNFSLTHYHFLWDIEKREVIGTPQFDSNGKKFKDRPITYKFNTNSKNFPYKCFYSVIRDEIFIFYRQGHAFTMRPRSIDKFRLERITDLDLGQMEILFDEALCVRSSGSILFFKQFWDYEFEQYRWNLYHQIKNVKGFLYFIRGNIRIQITNDKFIYFYQIDPSTHLPTLENVMYNYMMCNQMMIGALKRYSITYKQNEKNFEVYRRKYMHNLRVCVNDNNFEGSKAIEMPSSSIILVSNVNEVLLFDNENYKEIGKLPISLLESETREPNQIIGIQKSKDEKMVAVVSGKNLVMDEQKQNQLFIFRKVKAKSNFQYDQFELYRRIMVKDMPEFDKVCMQYHFKIAETIDTLIFVKLDQIFELNFETLEIKTIFKFSEEFSYQPSYFQTNHLQNNFVVSSDEKTIYVDLKSGSCKDFNELYAAESVKSILYDQEDQSFYFLCNIKNGVMGFYVFMFAQNDPSSFKVLTSQKQNLNIGDTCIYISRGITNQNIQYKELVCGFKTIYINTFTIVVLDLGTDVRQGQQTLQKHESFQLWESTVQGLLLRLSKEFVTFSKAGMNVVALGNQDTKYLKDNFGLDKILHSLDSLNYLKVDPANYVNCKCQNYENRVISIEQENVREDNSIFNTELYKIKLNEITLRELLILQSFYVSKTQSDIVTLIKMQPDPRFFYKTFLELGGANFCSLLSFDSWAMKTLLDEKNEVYFSEKFPIIYKNKFMKKNRKQVYYTNAIDQALKNHQIRAVQVILNYIVKYQNNFISSYLFLRNLPILMEKGIDIHLLLKSNIFNVKFDFDNWPGAHPDQKNCIRAYNGNLFDLRSQYSKIFDDFEPMGDNMNYKGQRIYKITYSINLLAQIGMHMVENSIVNEDVSLMRLCRDTDELEIFDAVSLRQIIQYKWDNFGRIHHVIGCLMHIFSCVIIVLYVKNAYVAESDDQMFYAACLIIGIVYPAIYDTIQLIRIGKKEYLDDLWNFFDTCFIFGSIVNIIIQMIYGPFNTYSRCVMCVLVLTLIIKTFFYLRIFTLLTPIVVMITEVVYDLRIFLIFYVILTFAFAQIFSVLGLGNDYNQGVIDPTGYAKYFQAIGLHFGEFFWIFMMSLGDFSLIKASSKLSKIDNQIFWLIWIITVIITCIIFLNFVVAEACASYSRIKDSLEQVQIQVQASLIAESEDMQFKRFKNNEKHPKYLINRMAD